MIIKFILTHGRRLMLNYRSLLMSLYLMLILIITINRVDALYFAEVPDHLPVVVEDRLYKKTVYVVGSCKPDTWRSRTFRFKSDEVIPLNQYLKYAAQAMDWPGVTRIQVCRI